jgi:hypothetical protein
MTVDIGQLAPNLEPEFTQWRTGEGGAAEWSLVADASAAGGRAIAQVSKDKTNYCFPLAIHKPFSGKDLEVLVRFKPVAGTVDQAGGIAVRLQTLDGYYVVRANALEDNVRFYRVVKGQREQLGGADVKVAPMCGIRSCWRPKAIASASPLTARCCSRPRTTRSPVPARSRYGPRRTA